MAHVPADECLNQLDIIDGLRRRPGGDQEITDRGLVELQHSPVHELFLQELPSADEDSEFQQLQEETTGDPRRPLVRGQKPDDGLEQVLVRSRVGVVYQRVTALRQPSSGVCLERLSDGIGGDPPPRLDRNHDTPVEVHIELTQILNPPVLGNRLGAPASLDDLVRGRRLPVVGVRPHNVRRADGSLGSDRVHASADQLELLRPRQQRVGGLQRDDRVLPAPEDAGAQEHLDLEHQVALLDVLGHPKVLRRAPRGDDVVRVQGHHHAVAELRADLEGLRSARDVLYGNFVAAVLARLYYQPL
uniref:Uncharacterized protein n=1 Tax=Zea mays TaxID=4577 RepID=A0A804R0B8_MAIZE